VIVLSVCLSVCLSFCERDNSPTQKRTSTKLGRHGQEMILYHLLTFGGDPYPRVDLALLFNFLHHGGLGDFWTFVK